MLTVAPFEPSLNLATIVRSSAPSTISISKLPPRRHFRAVAILCRRAVAQPLEATAHHNHKISTVTRRCPLGIFSKRPPVPQSLCHSTSISSLPFRSHRPLTIRTAAVSREIFPAPPFLHIGSSSFRNGSCFDVQLDADQQPFRRPDRAPAAIGSGANGSRNVRCWLIAAHVQAMAATINWNQPSTGFQESISLAPVISAVQLPP